MARLIIRGAADDPGASREVELERGELVFGRADEVDVALDNPTVSRRHAAVARTTQGWVLTDLGSANGTWVNGKRVTRRVLRHEDQVRLGTAELLFDEPPDPSATVMVDVGRVLAPDPAAKVPQAPVAAPPPPPAPSAAAAAAVAASWPEPAPPPPPEPPSRRDPAEPPKAQRIPIQPDQASGPPPPPAVGDRPLERPAETPADRPPRSLPDAAPAAARPSPGEAGFWIRVLAAVIDSLLLGVVTAACWMTAALAARMVAPRWPGAPLVLLPLGAAAAGLISLGYLLLGWALAGRTLGKLACRLRIVRDDGRALGFGGAALRLLGYLASSATLGIGYLMVAFTHRKRGLHDLIAGTVVVRE